MRSETRDYRTGDRDVVLDLTDDCAAFVAEEADGLLHVFVPHATAGIAILETGAGSDDDLLAALGDLLPADDTGGVSEAVAAAVRVVRESGLPNETNAMFTNIEGEWDEVLAVVKQAVDAVAARSPRVSLVLKADIRPGFSGQLTAKVERVEERLRR